ncbi:MAG: hypothetical protein ABEK29_08195, partial [Bradymonadaceae bacterium]
MNGRRSMQTLATIAVACTAFALAATGCQFDGSGQSDRDTGGWTLGDSGPDVGPDTGTDTGTETDGGTELPWTVQFELVNTTDEPVRIQKRSGCAIMESEWVSLHDGDGRMQARSTCGACSCDRDGPCAVCDCAPTPPTQLAPGESVSWTWEGYAFENDTVDGRTCTRRTV